jgi:hypothetical protein
MITLQDYIAMCDLDEAEVLAIAEHEHMPEIAAAALAQYLLTREHGAETIRDMLRDDIRSAIAGGDRPHAPRTFHGATTFFLLPPRGRDPKGLCLSQAVSEPGSVRCWRTACVTAPESSSQW